MLNDLNGAAALRRVAVDDPLAADAFGRLTGLARAMLAAPVALVSIVDGARLVLRGQRGLPEPWASLGEVQLDHSFCEHVLEGCSPFLVRDAREDARLSRYAAVRELGLVAYAGIPLVAPCGHVLGTLCVIDHVSRDWRPSQIQLLADLGACVMTEIELRAATRLASLHAERAEQRSLDTLALLNAVPDVFLALDSDSRCQYLNRPAEALFSTGRSATAGAGSLDAGRSGSVARNLIGQRVLDALPEAARLAVQKGIGEAMAGQRPAVIQFDLPHELGENMSGPGGRPIDDAMSDAPRAGDARTYKGRVQPVRHGVVISLREYAERPQRDASVQNPEGGFPAQRPGNDDDALVQIVAGGGSSGERALATLYDRYSSAIYGTLIRMLPDRRVAEELLHETFWRLWRHARQYEAGRVRFGTWLMRIATNLAISERRQLSRRPALVNVNAGEATDVWAVVGEPVDPAEDVPELAWRSEQRRLLSDALALLPREQRQAVELAYFGGFSHSEIATAQGAPPSTVKTRLALGLRKLEASLSVQALAG